ncbi:MAG: hypothetical protein AAF684_01660 [Pseudomonadota bacterium]
MLYALMTWKAAFGARPELRGAALFGHTESETEAFDRMMARAPSPTRRDLHA